MEGLSLAVVGDLRELGSTGFLATAAGDGTGTASASSSPQLLSQSAAGIGAAATLQQQQPVTDCSRPPPYVSSLGHQSLELERRHPRSLSAYIVSHEQTLRCTAQQLALQSFHQYECRNCVRREASEVAVAQIAAENMHGMSCSMWSRSNMI